jgi:hypothetical protein
MSQSVRLPPVALPAEADIPMNDRSAGQRASVIDPFQTLRFP